MSVSGPEIRLPRQPALVAGVKSCAWLSGDGEIENLDAATARRRLGDDVVPIVCHARATARRLDTGPFRALDILELFAFVHPARFALPTPMGISEALGLALPTSTERAALSLMASARALLADLDGGGRGSAGGDNAIAIATAMAQAGWPWGPAVLAALGAPDGAHSGAARNGLRVWTKLPDWQETPPEPPPENLIIPKRDALDRLDVLLGSGAEKRQGQRDYAETCTEALQPRNRRGEPNLVLAEAGTGIGKTLGYIAPASLWAERNQGTVWISTYTRNLQRQLDAELDRLCPTPIEKEARVVIRKGRENYLCLLKLADAVARLPTRSPLTRSGSA